MLSTSAWLKDTFKAIYLLFLAYGPSGLLLVPRIVRFRVRSLSSEMNYTDRCSGDDPACVGIVQSIEARPWHPRHVLCHGSHLSSSFLRYPEHTE